jgi:hypothetical protein
MPLRAPVSYHLDLYRYWLAKRGSHTMPARSDIDPADIPALLPYMAIIHKVDGVFHYRLVGTAVAQEIGRDLTGHFVGSHVRGTPKSVAALQAIGDRIFATASPVFTISRYQTPSGSIHNLSVLSLPLSDNGVHVDRIVYTRIARFNFEVRASTDWLKDAPLIFDYVGDIHSAAELEKLCHDWERSCSIGNPSIPLYG